MEQKRNIITDKLVVSKTGKSIEEWFKLLDKSGAKKMKHIEIFNLISGIEGIKILGQWNHNLLATTYEWDRGLKERGQKSDGFEISVSKTFGADAEKIYQYFTDESKRSKWLKEKNIETRKSTNNKSVVMIWKDDSSVRVELYKKSPDKSQAVVQQMKISDSKTAATQKDFWKKKLEELKNIMG